MKLYNKYNFHKFTFCIFTEVISSEIAHLKTNFTSKSGSSYIFTEEGVYRKSNHWGRAANCKWRLQSINSDATSRIRIGFAKWTEFQSINEIEKLYYIEVNFDENKVQYNHKNNSTKTTLYLRNATDTSKRVKQIRHFLTEDTSLDYMVSDNKEELKKEITAQLVETDKSFIQIKMQYL